MHFQQFKKIDFRQLFRTRIQCPAALFSCHIANSFRHRNLFARFLKPLAMLNKIIKLCEDGTVCTFVLGGHKVGGGRWTLDNVDADYSYHHLRNHFSSLFVYFKTDFIDCYARFKFFYGTCFRRRECDGHRIPLRR